MQCIVLKENLGKAFGVVGRTISSRPQLPILSTILLKAQENRVSLCTTNLDVGTRMTIAAKVEEEGETAAPGKLLTDFVSSLSADKITFHTEGSTLILRTSRTHATFSTVSSADFPPFPEYPKTAKTFPYSVISQAILRVASASSVDETRPVLTGIRFRLSGKYLSLAATDGYRMSMETVVLPKETEDFYAILPARTLSDVVRTAEELKAEHIGFSLIEKKNQLVFLLPDVEVFTRLIDGEFPNIEKIIPQTCKTKVTVVKEELAQAVKTASLFARGAANIVRITITKDGLKIQANAPQIGQDESLVEAKVEGEEMEAAFNYRFLLDLLGNFPGDTIVFESSGPLNPGVFKPSDPSSSFVHIIMPVRVQN